MAATSGYSGEGYGPLPGTSSSQRGMDEISVAAEDVESYQQVGVSLNNQYSAGDPYSSQSMTEAAPLSVPKPSNTGLSSSPSRGNVHQSALSATNQARHQLAAEGSAAAALPPPEAENGACPGFGGVDGNLRFALLGCLLLEFLFGSWANIEPVIRIETGNVSVDQRASWAGLPSSYNFSLYFVLCLGIISILSRSCATGFMLAFFTAVSMVQDWILFAVYWSAMSSALSVSQPDSAKRLLQFTRFSSSLIAAHLAKAAIVAFGLMLFSRRGGNMNVKIRGLPKTSYQRMRGQTGGVPLY